MVATMVGVPTTENTDQAPHSGAFSFARLCLALALFIPFAAAASDCRLPAATSQQAVDFVYDGDTIRLHDGTRLRLVGINTPEVAHKDKPGEPRGDEARARLQQIIDDAGEIGIAAAADSRDRYNRLLAYIYDQQGRDIQRILLAEGLAFAVSVPPNLAHVPCYFDVEQQARRQRRGLWSEDGYRPLSLPASPADGGFMLVQGKVTRVGNSRKSIWLNFSPGDAKQARAGLSVRVAKSDLAGFKTLDPATLQGKTITARGWVSFYKKEPVLRVRHEASLQVLD